jgi:DNA replicative helicase MCM subunit Mcm2 (Cdc46/Mcm family)
LPSPKPPQSQIVLLHNCQHSQPSLSLFLITTFILVYHLHCILVCIIRARTIHNTISITGLISTRTTIKITVRYHVARCTKNKRMIRIPMCGLFLTCTENPFFIKHTQHKIRAGA